MTTDQAGTIAQGKHFGEYIGQMRSAWAPGQDAALPERARRLLEALLRETPDDEAWVAGLLRDRPSARELYRDPAHGFLQMGHLHPLGQGGNPHDHGPYWVLYGVYRGAIEISKYRRVDGGAGQGATRLEVVETVRLTPGTVMPYLPGEIHAPRALDDAGSVVMRFLSADVDAIERFRFKPLDAGLIPAGAPPSAGRYEAIYSR